ncbi:MAG: pilus assembly protein, partial [Schumannella sp.]|nr:pilus assembly protein [Schumannella sp.]
MSGTPPFDRVAALVQRLAVLTAAGIPPLAAWRYLVGQASDSPDDLVARIVQGATSAYDLPARIAEASRDGPEAERSAWNSLAAVWTVATEVGAPLAPALDRSAGVLRALAQSARDVEVALAGPAATSRIVLALP